MPDVASSFLLPRALLLAHHPLLTNHKNRYLIPSQTISRFPFVGNDPYASGQKSQYVCPVAWRRASKRFTTNRLHTQPVTLYQNEQVAQEIAAYLMGDMGILDDKQDIKVKGTVLFLFVMDPEYNNHSFLLI